MRAIPPGNDKIFAATGFDKWGMTNVTAAAPGVVEPDPWRAVGLGGRVRKLEPARAVGHPEKLIADLEVGLNLAKGWITPVA